MSKTIQLKISLTLVGSLLGPLNLGLFFIIGSEFNKDPFYEKMTSLQAFSFFGGFWYFLMFVPCLISTGLTLLTLWNRLLVSKTKKEHMIWGMIFGGVATIFSTTVFILFGAIDYYANRISSIGEVFLGIGLAIPGGFSMGLFFIILFSPAILISGPLYGIVAMKLKQIVLSE